MAKIQALGSIEDWEKDNLRDLPSLGWGLIWFSMAEVHLNRWYQEKQRYKIVAINSDLWWEKTKGLRPLNRSLRGEFETNFISNFWSNKWFSVERKKRTPSRVPSIYFQHMLAFFRVWMVLKIWVLHNHWNCTLHIIILHWNVILIVNQISFGTWNLKIIGHSVNS